MSNTIRDFGWESIGGSQEIVVLPARKHIGYLDNGPLMTRVRYGPKRLDRTTMFLANSRSYLPLNLCNDSLL